MTDITQTATNLDAIMTDLQSIYPNPTKYIGILVQLISSWGYDTNTQSITSTTNDPVFALARRVALNAIYMMEPNVTWTSSTEATDFGNQILPLFNAEVLYSGDNDETDVFQWLNDAMAFISKDIQTRGSGLPDLVSRSYKTNLPACQIANLLYGDGSRDEEIIIRNNPKRPMFMETSIEVLSR